MNIAQQVSRIFGDDGQCFDVGEIYIEDICQDHGSAIEYRDGWNTYPVKHVFGDGSSIVVDDNAWDLGLTADAKCFCFAGNGRCECQVAP